MLVAFAALLALAVLAAAALLPADAQAQGPTGVLARASNGGGFHFKDWRHSGDPALGVKLLTQDERDFVERLPVVRVGLALPAFRPYEDVADDGEISGIHVELLWQLARAFGIRLQPVVYGSFPAALEAAERREVDLLMSLGVNAERARYLEFTLGATPMVSAIFQRTTPASPVHAPEKGIFAIERGNIANDFIRRRYPDAAIIPAEHRDAALRLVLQGDADFYIGNLLPTLDHVQREKLRGVEVLRLVEYGTGYYHFAVRKDWAPLARILNKGIGARGPQVPEALDLALASLPKGVTLQPRRNLSPEQWRTLLDHPVWRVGAVRDLVSLNEIDAAGRHQGIAAEYTDWVARRLGVGVELVAFDSVAELLDGARNGKVDVIPLLTRTDARERDFAFSRPYVELPYMIVGRRDGPMYWDLASLRGKKLALARQHPLREILAERYPEIQIVDVGGGQGAMDAVAFGLADAAVEVKLYANLRIHADADSLRLLGQVDELPAQFHFATRKPAAKLVSLIDEVLVEVPDSERARMLRRWVAVDLPAVFPWRRYLPLIAVSGMALLIVLGSGLWWFQRLRREVRSRHRSEEQLADIGAHLPCVAYRTVFDAAGRLRSSYHSAGSEQVLGLKLDPTRSVIDNLAERVRPEDLEAARKAREACLREGQPMRITVRYEHPDGKPRWLHSESVPKALGGSQKGLVAMTGYIVDVTSEFELQARLAREARARHLLLASASHELRAPTHTLSLALQAIENGAGDAARHLGVARAATRTLSELISDVLDAARLDEGQLQLRPQVFALRELLQQIAAATRAWAAEKGLSFEWEVHPAVPAQVLLDPLRLQQIVTNLLSNAVKYTERGHVRLRAAMEGSALSLRVDDSGPGIAADRLAQLFTPYEAASGQAPVPHGSSGLGLSICRRLAALMGGEVSLHSSAGQGTTATLRLPLPPLPASEAAAAAPVPRTLPESSVRGQRVLVCDDDPTSRLLMTMVLQASGFEVESVGHAAAALERWRQGDIGAVITDLDMPGMPGGELMAHIRAAEAEQSARTRLLVCTGNVEPEPALAPAPHDAYLVKPVDVAMLVRTLGELGIHPRQQNSNLLEPSG